MPTKYATGFTELHYLGLKLSKRRTRAVWSFAEIEILHPSPHLTATSLSISRAAQLPTCDHFHVGLGLLISSHCKTPKPRVHFTTFTQATWPREVRLRRRMAQSPNQRRAISSFAPSKSSAQLLGSLYTERTNCRPEATDPAILLTARDAGSTCMRYIHKSLLCARAPLFIGLTQGNDVVDFPDWRPETINSFADWVLYGRVMVRGLNYEGNMDIREAVKYENDAPPADGQQSKPGDPPRAQYRPWYASFNADPVAKVLARVLDLFVFAMVGNISALQVECILTWQRQICGPHNIVLYGSIIRAVVDRTATMENRLCDFVIEWAAFTLREDHWNHAKLASLPSPVLAKLLRLALGRANSGVETKHGVPDPNLDWCRYHGHATRADGEICRAARPDDYDMRMSAQRQNQTSRTPLPDVPTPPATAN